MGENLVPSGEHLITPKLSQSLQTTEVSGSSKGFCSHSTGNPSYFINIKDEEHDEGGEEEPLLVQKEECRICQEEDSGRNLETPCACNGSLKPYQPAYTAPPRSEVTTIDISSGCTIGGTPVDLHDPRLLAMAVAEHHLLETEYAEYEDTSASGATFLRSSALILMALLLLRHALSVGDGDDDADDASTFFFLFLLRAAGFLLPCYISAWAISVVQRRRQAQASAQHRGLQVTIAPGLTPATGSTLPPLH